MTPSIALDRDEALHLIRVLEQARQQIEAEGLSDEVAERLGVEERQLHDRLDDLARSLAAHEERERLDRRSCPAGWVTVREAAERLGVDVREVYRRLNDGDINGLQVAGDRRIFVDEGDVRRDTPPGGC